MGGWALESGAGVGAHPAIAGQVVGRPHAQPAGYGADAQAVEQGVVEDLCRGQKHGVGGGVGWGGVESMRGPAEWCSGEERGGVRCGGRERKRKGGVRNTETRNCCPAYLAGSLQHHSALARSLE